MEKLISTLEACDRTSLLRTSLKLISIREACERTSLSRTTLWRLVRDGQFPAPIAFGRGVRKAFVEAEVTAYIEARIAEREKARSAA